MNPEAIPYESFRIDDIRFAYQRAGQGGLPVVLLHGRPQTSWAWRRGTAVAASPIARTNYPRNARWNRLKPL
jgi:pimeloyl-ACP methyl ester carboxylesterase